MKINLFAILPVLLGGSLLVPAGASQPSPARVLGDIPDGTPPAPEAPKPAFVVPAKEILETKTVPQGGRAITIQRIKPIALPEPAKAPAPLDIHQAVIQQRIAQAEAEQPGEEMLFVSANVFRANDGSARTLATVHGLGEGGPITFWSSADFSYLSGFSSFIGSDGATRSLIMAWSAEEIDSPADLAEKTAPESGLRALLQLPPGKSTFSLVSPNPSTAALAAVQSLHDLYNNEYDRLKTAYEGREQARLARENELKAHPPKPKDIVLNHWRIAPAAQPAEKGAAQ